MSEQQQFGSGLKGRQRTSSVSQRVVGSPLPIGGPLRSVAPPKPTPVVVAEAKSETTAVVDSPAPFKSQIEAPQAAAINTQPVNQLSQQTPASSLAQPQPTQQTADNDLSNTLQRVFNSVRSTLPFLQKLLPLLDGNVATSVATLLSHPQQPVVQSAPTDLAPIESHLVAVKTQQRELSNQVAEQNVAIKRFENQLEAVREATDRNTLEQQELIEDLKSIHSKISQYAWIVLLLLLISVGANIFLFIHINRLLP